MTRRSEVIIVGAGLAGLTCGLRLGEAGIPFTILEASDHVGGRVRTDSVGGFLLDRGFQVLLTAYPEAQQVLDYRALRLHPFRAGAVVRVDGMFHRISDPWRSPPAGFLSLFTPIGSFADKMRIAGMRRRVLRASPEELLLRPETTARRYLERTGFTKVIIERFFRPFFGGVFLDGSLETSSRMLEYCFRMFAIGSAALPAGGMGEIPAQIAGRLPEGSVQTGRRVAAARPGRVRLVDGTVLEGDAVVIAVDGVEAARMTGRLEEPRFRRATCLYFEAPAPPIRGPHLVLNGDGDGPINNLCVPSEVAPSYAPEGRSLVSVTAIDDAAGANPGIESAVRGQLEDWFGRSVRDWRTLDIYRIGRALPDQSPASLSPIQRPVAIEEGLWVAGDHRDQGSIQGAMVSGRRTADAVIAALEREAVVSV